MTYGLFTLHPRRTLPSGFISRYRLHNQLSEPENWSYCIIEVRKWWQYKISETSSLSEHEEEAKQKRLAKVEKRNLHIVQCLPSWQRRCWQTERPRLPVDDRRQHRSSRKAVTAVPEPKYDAAGKDLPVYDVNRKESTANTAFPGEQDAKT